MWPRIILVAGCLVLCGCGMYRAAEQSQPVDIPYRGPLRPVSLTPAQIKVVQAGMREAVPEPASATFGNSYRAGVSANGSIAVCGFINGKRFVGLFAKPIGGNMEFLPIKIASEGNEDMVGRFCRINGIYLPRQ